MSTEADSVSYATGGAFTTQTRLAAQAAASLPEAFYRLPDDQQAIQTDIFEAEGLFVKQIVIPKAESFVPQHSHALSHLTLLAIGSINVWEDGVFDKRYDAPTALHIRAGVKHLFLTLVDGTTLYCIHATETAEALKILAEHDPLA